MSRINLTVSVILILCFAPLHAEKSSWIIAAEAFKAEGVPSVYENLETIIPTLILSRIGGLGNRLVLPSEKKARDLQEMSVQRVKLIKERSDLIRERDKIFFLTDTEAMKKKRKKESANAILKKDKEIAAQDAKIKIFLADFLYTETSDAKIELWKDGHELYVRSPDLSLSASLRKDTVSALLTGTIEDIAGFLYVTVRIETGLETLVFESFSEAISYEDIDTLASSLTARLLPEVANKKIISLAITAIPEDARVFIDGRLIPDLSVPVRLFAGEHRINTSASGYESVEKTAMFGEESDFAMNIVLVKEKAVSVAFDAKNLNASIFLHTHYLGETPFPTPVPVAARTTIGEAVTGDALTYFIFDPALFIQAEEIHVQVKPNSINTGKRIEKQRGILYWAIGALYISLPVSMLSYGVSMNKSRAYEENKLPQTKEMVNEINNWSRASVITRWISIGLGLNTVVQLVRYIMVAEQATPKYAQPSEN